MAQRKLDSSKISNSDDPDLLYLQGELWFQNAESNYKKQNFKTAMLLYKQAIALWPNHSGLKERIKSMDQKVLVDGEIDIKNARISNTPENGFQDGYSIFLDETLSKGNIAKNGSHEFLEKDFQMGALGFSLITLPDGSETRLLLFKPVSILIFGFLVSAATSLCLSFFCKRKSVYEKFDQNRY